MGLPSNTFMFNYNAKDYVPSTRTFPKTTGQLFDEDLVLNADIAVGDGYVNFTGNSYMVKSYNANSNPFNVTTSSPHFTLIYKTSGWTADNTNIVSNRGTNFNFMMRGNRCIFGTEYCIFTPTSNPQIMVIRADTGAAFSRQEWDSNGNVLTGATATGTFGSTSDSFNFFCGKNNGGEPFRSIFYWMYLSMETLTDEQVMQVIKYNEPEAPTPILIPYNNLFRNGVNLN